MSQTKAQLIEGLNINTSAPADALVIDSSGNVGIGTTSPSALLTIGSTSDSNTNATIASSTSGTGGLYFNDGANSGALIYDHTNNFLQFRANGSERMRIDSSGQLLVGTTSDVSDSEHAKVHIASTGGGALALGRDDSSVTSGNGIGLIRFYGNDGGSYQECARIEVSADGTHANNDKPARIEFHTTADGASSPTERMRIDSSGQVGIGLSAPGGMLHVKTPAGVSGNENTVKGLVLQENSFSSANLLELQNSVGSGITAFDQAGQLGIGTTSPAALCHINNTSGTTLYRASVAGNSTIGLEIVKTGSTTQSWRIVDGQTVNGKLEFYDVTDSATRMCIDGSGNVGIGTTSPGTNLHISKGAAGEALRLSADSNNLRSLKFTSSDNGIYTGGIWDRDVDSSGGIHTWSVNGTERARIDSSGNVGIGLTSPSSKTHIKGGSLTVEHGSPNTGTGQLNINCENNSQATFSFDDQGHISFGTAATPHNQGSFSEKLRIQNGGGISFNGDTAAVNALDDYEEGTWTPSVTSSGYATTTQVGYYTKIGRLVTVHFKYKFSAIGTTNSSIQFTGLPFTVSSALHMVGVARETTTSGDIFVAQVNENSTNFSLNSLDGIANSSNQIFLTGKDYNATISYFV